MKVLLYSDIHHGHFVGKVDSNGLDARVNDTLAIEEHITKYCVDNNIGTVLFLGDRFESRNPPIWLINLVDTKWLERIKAGIRIYAIIGNHDSYRIFHYGHSYSNLWSGVGGIQLYAKPDYALIDGINFGLLPYGFPVSDIKECDVFCFHESVIGHEDERGFKPFEGYDYDDVRKKAKVFFAGHIHSHESIGPTGCYLGCPYQKDAMDIGKDRGFTILDLKTLKSKFVKIDSPRIIEIRIDDLKDIKREDVHNNYVRCIVPSGDERKATDIIKEFGPRHYTVSPMRARGLLIENMARSIYKQDKIEDIIGEYVGSRDIANKAILKETGLKIWGDTE